MTVLHSGTTQDYSDHWGRAFGTKAKRKSTLKTAKKKAAPKKGVSAKKKTPVAKKKVASKKSKRK
ncbi:MAG: hypothetical protein ACC628_02625 [Pirellulaceae bacterium]